MVLRNKIHIGWYVVSDFIAALTTWIILYVFRSSEINQLADKGEDAVIYSSLLWGLIFVPMVWIIIYFLTGRYNSLYKKSRFDEITATFLSSLFGCTVIFFYFWFPENNRLLSYYYWVLM
ncbi:MAG: hypothetical protein ABIN89_22110 [Chitinophagaceae bacterium]